MIYYAIKEPKFEGNFFDDPIYKNKGPLFPGWPTWVIFAIIFVVFSILCPPPP